MSPRSRLAVALVSTALIAYIAVGSLLGRVLGDTSYGQLSIFGEVVRLVIDSYVEPVNLDRAMAGARQGMSDALDGDSAYLEPEEFKLYQQAPRDADAEVGLVLTRRFAFVMVVSPRPGSPAEKAGLRPGDLVKSVDDKHTRQMPAVVAERLLRGAPGSSVKLGILRAGADPFDVTLVRERIVPSAPTGKLLGDGVGYVKVADFTPTTAEDVRTQVEALKKGGARNFFLHGGPVAKLVGRRQAEQLLQADASRQAWSGPLVALVGNGTAGPGEIVAAALSEADRAKLVGEHTFGRAGVTQPVPLPEGGLLLTTAKYVSPKGAAIHGEGLKPTVPVEERTDEDDDLPADAPRPDRALDKALDLLKTGGTEAKKAAA
jgi:carboxyl-terminal processing protease